MLVGENFNKFGTLKVISQAQIVLIHCRLIDVATAIAYC